MYLEQETDAPAADGQAQHDAIAQAGVGTEKKRSSKVWGAGQTPVKLAAFVAAQIVQVAEFSACLPEQGVIRVLDPAPGDGNLLEALLRQLPPPLLARVRVYGFGSDAAQLQQVRQRLQLAWPQLECEFSEGDFFDYVLAFHNGGDLFSQQQQREPFHLVVANPPQQSARAGNEEQILGLCKAFGLSGRRDLYYPFVLAISRVLATGGIGGIVCSNRFMATKSAHSVRRALLTRFEMLQIWDLGDSKLADTAVLLARGSAQERELDLGQISFSSLSAASEAEREQAQESAPDPLAALAAANQRLVALPKGKCVRVRHGHLETGGDPGGIWRIATSASDEWLATVQAHTWQSFASLGQIRSGIKTEGDKVFVRADWDTLGETKPELLRPLINKYNARRFRGVEAGKLAQRKQILYPHPHQQASDSGTDLQAWPHTLAYLEQQRDHLEHRNYLLEAGRNWYELWVPPDPSGWTVPKLVFRDIAEEPVFWLDTEGGIVDSDCYWLRCERDEPGAEDLLWLALAVANSSFIVAFYDKCFNNRLYAGRRRFLAQFVARFPLPDPLRPEARELIRLAKAIHAATPYAATPSPQAEQMAQEMNAKVWRAFGVFAEASGGIW